MSKRTSVCRKKGKAADPFVPSKDDAEKRLYRLIIKDPSSRRIPWLAIYLAAIIALGVLFEILINFRVVERIWLLGKYKLILRLLSLPFIWAFASTVKRERKKLQPRRSDERIATAVMQTAGIYAKALLYDTTFILVVLVIVGFTGSVAWGALRVGTHITDAAMSFCTAIYGEIGGISGRAGKDNGAREKQNEIIETEKTVETKEVEEPTLAVTTERSEETSPRAEKMLPDSLEKSKKPMILDSSAGQWLVPDEILQKVLFQTGYFMLSEDMTDQQIDQILDEYLLSLRQQAKTSEFDLYADQTLKGQVARASIQDANLYRSSEKDQVIHTRLNAYSQWEKETLARLLAEDFNDYALAYAQASGESYIIVSFYVLSLEWLYECMKYQSLPEEEQNDILNSIYYRYKDIMMFSETGSMQYGRAKLLSEAFARKICPES